jgi:hypothetical protein
MGVEKVGQPGLGTCGPVGYESVNPCNSEHNRVNQNHVFLARGRDKRSHEFLKIQVDSGHLRKKRGKF